MEDSTANSRQPVIFNIDIPAPAKYRLSCTDGFDAIISKDGVEPIKWVGVKDTLLKMGRYTITVLAQKAQNLKEYHLSVTTSTLVPGISLPITTYNNKQIFKVSVGKKTVVEIFSQGMRDVEGVLRKENSDTILMQNDDGTNDWNFKISRVLDPGFYTVEVNNRGSSRGTSNIVMVSLEDTVLNNLTLNTVRKINLDGKIVTIPVNISTDTEILNFTVTGGSRVGATIERKDKAGNFTVIGQREGETLSLSSVLLKDNTYRVRLWSTDHLNESVDVSVNTGTFEDVSIHELIKGIKAKGTATGILTSVWLRLVNQSDSLNHYRISASNSLFAVRSCKKSNTVFESDFEDYLSVSQKTVFVELQFEKEGKQSIKAENLNLDSSVTFPVSYIPRAFTCKKQNDEITVFKVHMNTGSPMCGLFNAVNADFSPGGFPVWRGAFQGAHDAVCVSLPEESNCFFAWNADVKTARTENNISVQTRRIKITDKISMTQGEQTWNARGLDAKVYSCTGKEMNVIKVIVPKGGVIVWKRPDGTRKLFTTYKNLDYVTLNESEGQLYCINTEWNGYFSIECLSSENADGLKLTDASVEPDKKPFEYNFPRSGEEKITIACTMKDLSRYKLFVQNSSGDIDWWTGNGMLVRSIRNTGEFPVNELPVFRPQDHAGFVTFEHNPGWTVVNVHNKKSANTCWGNDLSVSKSREIKNSQVINMENGVNWLSLNIDKPTQVQIATDVSCIGILLKDKKPVRTFIGTEGFSADMPLTSGQYVFGIRSLGGISLEQVSLTVVCKTIETITEDNPPHVRLASGESSILQFTLNKKQTIGIGLKTDHEVMQAKLFADDFTQVCEGQQQFLTLEKGTYYLWLHVPYYQEAAECEVKLVGQNVPSDMPPENEIRKFKIEE